VSKQTVEVRDKLFENGREVEPFIPLSSYSDAMVTPWNKVTITGSASDEAVAISDVGTVLRLDLKVRPADVDKISVKYNGSSKAYNVSPIEITSENITAITASNSNSAAVNLFWRAIYE